MPDDVLTQMTADGFGPVILADAGKGIYTAKVADGEVSVSVDASALCFTTAVAVAWPQSLDGRETDSILTSLEELAHVHRPDLVTIEPVADGQLIVRMWAPLEGISPRDVAGGVLGVSRIATLARATVHDQAALLQLADLDVADEEEEVIEVIPPPPPPPE